MNLLKIQDMLKGAPDQALVGYVQNPSGQVPTYLALSELQRRKEMRASYQADKPEDKSVAEDLVQESQPQPQPGIAALPQGKPMQQAMQPPAEMPTQQMAQGGLAELDVGDMYNENNYANGGIIAFAGKDGSEVKADEPTSWLGRNIGAPLKNWYQREHDAMMRDDAIEAYKLEHGVMPWTAQTLAERNAYDLGLTNLKAKSSGNTPPAKEYPSGNKIPGADVAPPATDPNAKPAAEAKPAPAAEVDPFAALRKQLVPGTPEKQKTAKEFMADYTAMLGEDPNAAAAKDRLAKMEARANKQEEQVPWMALAKAGFAMAAGKSPHALQNIAEGATVGVTDYASAKDKLEQLRDKHFELQSQLDRQARAEQVSAATYGANSKEHQDDRAARERLEKMTLGNQLAIAQLNYGLNTQNKSVANRDKAIDNAMAKTKIIAEQKGISDANDFDAIYQPILAQEMAALGVTSGTGNAYKPPVSGTLQAAKNGVLNYVRNAAK
jgi:hypothetical protein